MNEVTFKSLDGLTIYGHLCRPPADAPRPAVMFVSAGVPGGGAKRRDGSYQPLVLEACQELARRGYVAFVTDYRGALGHGEAYARLLDGGGKCVDDLVAGIEYLRALPFVRADRLALWGNSSGAYHAALVCERVQSVRAAVCVMGFYDLAMQYEHEVAISKGDYRRLPSRRFHKMSFAQFLKGYPHLERSPMFHADRFSCPALLVHGENDWLVPPIHSKAFYRALQEAGKEAELVLLDDLPHGLPKSEEARQRYGGLIYGFLEKHLSD